MTNRDFLAWMQLRAQQTGKPYRNANAARDLGMNQSNIDRALARADYAWDQRTALACAAVAAGLPPFKQNPPV